MQPLTPQAWLKSRKVRYSEAVVKLSQINEQRSRNNQARQEAIDPELVDDFAQDMRNGDTFPPIIVYKAGTKYVVIDGNHRHAAAKKAATQVVGADQLQALVVENLGTEEIRALTIEANRFNGKRPDKAWRIIQAVNLVQLGYSTEEAASRAGISRGALSDHMKAESANERAAELGVAGFADLPVTTRSQLDLIGPNPVFGFAAKLAVESGMPAAGARMLLKELKALRSEEAQIAHIGSERERRMPEIRQMAATGTVKRHRITNPKTDFLMGLGKVLKMKPQKMAEHFLTDEERTEMARRCLAAEELLMELEELLSSAN